MPNFNLIIASAALSLIGGILIQEFRFRRKARFKRKTEREDWLKEARILCREIQTHSSNVISENAKKEERIPELSSFSDLKRAYDELERHLNRSPKQVETDLEMELWYLKQLFESMDFWEVYDESNFRKEIWHQAADVKEKIEAKI